MMNLPRHRVNRNVLGSSQKCNDFYNGAIFSPHGGLTLLIDLLTDLNGCFNGRLRG